METKVTVKCVLCGADIELDYPRYSIGQSDICDDCAATMTLSDIYSTEKIKDVSFFDGKIWWNPFCEPVDEGDTGEAYDAEIPVKSDAEEADEVTFRQFFG